MMSGVERIWKYIKYGLDLSDALGDRTYYKGFVSGLYVADQITWGEYQELKARVKEYCFQKQRAKDDGEGQKEGR